MERVRYVSGDGACGNGGAAGEERLGNQRITAICAGYVGVLLLFIYAQYVPVIVVG